MVDAERTNLVGAILPLTPPNRDTARHSHQQLWGAGNLGSFVHGGEAELVIRLIATATSVHNWQWS